MINNRARLRDTVFVSHAFQSRAVLSPHCLGLRRCVKIKNAGDSPALKNWRGMADRYL